MTLTPRKRIVGNDHKRFWSRVSKTRDCWLWKGRIRPDGYAEIWMQGRYQRVHRVSYEWANGPIPEGLTIDHICWNRSCVNPSHLRAVTHAQNTQNLEGVRSDSGTGYRGVAKLKSCNKYEAYAKLNGKRIYLGLYGDPIEAAKVSAQWRREHMPYSTRDQMEGDE